MDGWGGERQIGEKIENIEKKHVERYEYAQKYCENKDVLDAACGCGYGSNILSENAKCVLGVDYSQEAIEYAQKFWDAENIALKQFDLNADLTVLGKFDVIVSLETVEHLDTPVTETCRKFHEILRSGGLLIISHPENEDNPKKAGYIKKTIEYVKRREFSHLAKAVIGKLFYKKEKSLGGFHKHHEIKGEFVKKQLIDIGFQIKHERYQPGRFDYQYHLIVAEKK